MWDERGLLVYLLFWKTDDNNHFKYLKVFMLNLTKEKKWISESLKQILQAKVLISVTTLLI